jgi:hypothetical protein
MEDLYYRSSSQYKRRSFGNTRRSFKLLTPLFVLVMIIIVVWIIVKFITFLAGLNNANLDNAAQVFVADGKVQTMGFGGEEFAPLFSGQTVLEGDRVRTLSGGKAVVTVFEGVTVRMDESTDILFEELENDENKGTAIIKVNAGDIWVNKADDADPNYEISITTDYLSVRAAGTVFAVHAGLPEIVRVIDGDVLVDVLDVKDVLDQINMGVGQEAILTSGAFESFKLRETPSILGSISADFQGTDWYKWNISEDKDPTSFQVDPALTGDNSTVIESETPAEFDSTTPETGEPEEVTTSTIEAPVVTFPEYGVTITDETINILGNAPTGAEKIMVTSFEETTPSPYILKGYKAGDATWKYIAKFDGGEGNMIVGENRYEVVAIDSAGEESEVATIMFIYEPADNTVVNSPDELAAPTISIVNDQPAGEKFVLSEDRAYVEGQVGTWAKSVVVNDYTLREYKAYSGKFSYILSPEFDNLVEGDNVINMYAVDSQGNKSPVGTFTITWEK